MPTARLEVTGEEVDTTSEAWRHECEARYILDTLKTRQERNRFLDCDVFDPATRRRTRGIKQQRGEAEEKRLRATVMLIVEARKKAAAA